MGKQEIEGIPFYVSDKECDSVDEIEAFKSTFLRDQYQIKELLKKPNFSPKVIFDCGSHIGSFSYLAKTLWPEARVVVIEPNSDSMKLAQKNISQVSCDKVSFLNGGLWYNDIRPKYFMKNDYHKTCSKLVLEEDRYDLSIKKVYEDHLGSEDQYMHMEHDINLYTIEGIMDILDINHIDLMKIDIQCAEYDFFKNTKLTSNDVDVIVGELHDTNELKNFKDKAAAFNKAFSNHEVVDMNRPMSDSSTENKWVFKAFRN